MGTLVNISDAKSGLSRFAERAAAGEDIVIAKRRRPIALLTRLPAKRKKIPWNIYKGQIEMAKDFDAPLDVFKDYM